MKLMCLCLFVLALGGSTAAACDYPVQQIVQLQQAPVYYQPPQPIIVESLRFRAPPQRVLLQQAPVYVPPQPIIVERAAIEVRRAPVFARPPQVIQTTRTRTVIR